MRWKMGIIFAVLIRLGAPGGLGQVIEDEFPVSGRTVWTVPLPLRPASKIPLIAIPPDDAQGKTKSNAESKPGQAAKGPAQSKKSPPKQSLDGAPSGNPGNATGARAETGPRKIIVRAGGADEPTAQIVTGMAPEEANRQRQDAEQLLKATDATVKRAAPGPVDAQRQETGSQIHNYMQGDRKSVV